MLSMEGYTGMFVSISLIPGPSEGLKIRGCQYYLVGIILVEIGLTDLSKSGGAMALPAPPGTTGLKMAKVPEPQVKQT